MIIFYSLPSKKKFVSKKRPFINKNEISSKKKMPIKTQNI